MHNTLDYFTEEELINRVWDREDIQEVMAKRFYYAANEQRREEVNNLWVTGTENRGTASYGKNWGYYVGMDAISRYYVVEHSKRLMENLESCCHDNPEISSAPENKGFGYMAVHPLTTPLIEIAGDGKTAKGLWYCIGQETSRKPDGTSDPVWFSEKVGADFIKEGDEWKIWHLCEIIDVRCRAGEDYSAQSVIIDPDDPQLLETKEEFGKPTIGMLTHDSRFNWSDNYPWMPEPYFTFSDEISYGPKGHPYYKEAWEK